MKRKIIFKYFFYSLLLVVSSQKAFSQCFEIESLLVAACVSSPGTEGYNEMVRFKVGAAPLNTAALSVTWPAQSWQGLIQNAATAAKVASINSDIALAGGCGQLLEPVAGILPANAEVILVTSENFSATANVFGAITQNIYIIFQNNAAVTAGHFGNYSATPGLRTLLISFGACSDSVTYDRSLLSPNPGATANFTPAGVASYTNPGCVAPVDTFSVDAGTTPVNACPGQTVSLSGTSVGYTAIAWTAPSGSFSASGSLATNYTVPASASGSIVVTLTATNACGTNITDAVTVNVSAAVTPTFNAVPAICSGATLTPLPTTSTNSITGTWSPALNNTLTTTYTFTPNTGQCATTATLTITVNASNVTPTFNAVPAICSGATLSPLPTTSTNSITGTWSPALNNTLTTTYTFTPNTGQCATTATLTITVNASNVTPTFNAVPAICSGATLSPLPTTSTNSITGTWSPALNNTLTTTYTFTPTTGQCATTATLTITVNASNVTPTFNAVPAICSGATLSPLPTTSTNSITGTWSPALNNTLTTTYTFTPNTGQCATTATLTITVNASNVTPTFNAVPAICSGATLSPLPTTSTNSITGTWSPALNNTLTTTYTFTPTTGQCATTATLTITVNASNVTPTFNAVPAICSGATLSPLPTTSTNSITGTWSPALNNALTTTYTFTPNTGQCATTATLTINVNPNVIPTFNAVAPICSGATLSPLPTTSTNAITGTWSPAPNNTLTTTYTFTPNAGQCATTATLMITVNASNVTPTFTAVAPICSGAALAPLPVTSTNGITGSWSPALNNTLTTTYTFTPNTGQCASTAALTINVNPNVIPTFNAVPAICSGTILAPLPPTSNNGITGTWSPALNNAANTTYTFTPNAGQCATTATLSIVVNQGILPTFSGINQLICPGDILPPLPTASTNGITGTWSPALNNIVTTLYTFTPDAGQCAVNASIGITVNDGIIPLFDGTAIPAFICNGMTLSPLPSTSMNGITGNWSPALSNTATTTYTFTPDAGQCATINRLTINVIQPVTKNETYFICLDSAGNALISATINTGLSSVQYSFAWSSGSGPIANSASSYMTTAPGIYTVEATNLLTGCVTYTLIAEVKGVIPATASITSTGDFSDAQQIIVTVTGGIGSYEYQLNDGAYQTGNVFNVYDGGEYTVHVKDNLGCNEFDLHITVMNYPKFFTPNNDGYNDTWNIHGLHQANNAELYIFDRYGKLVKQISPYGAGWDGTCNGHEMPATDYWFKLLYLDRNGISKEFKSHFALKR